MKIKMELSTEDGWIPAVITLPDNLTPQQLFQAGTLVGVDASMHSDLWDDKINDRLQELKVDWQLKRAKR